jgi:pimeloyl-ACP methyl ester carboxylesterase
VIYLLSLVALGLVLLYAGLLGMLWWFQEQVVFQPPNGVPAFTVPARRVVYHTTDSIPLFAYIVGDCTPTSTLVLAFHGNADVARWFVPWATSVRNETGACVVIPEYRGYDGAPGAPTYPGSALDARAAMEFVRDSLRVEPSQMIYFGHSLGTAIAAELAAYAPPRALILQAPFSTARAMAARMFLPGLAGFWGMVSRVHFDTIARVRALRAPVYVAHGTRDIIIPVHMGREVFAASAVKGELLIVPDAGHNDVAEVGGNLYWRWLVRAIRGSSPATASTPATEQGKRSAP